MFLRATKSTLCCLLVWGLALASFGTFAAPNYFIRTWQVEQGLPQNKVTTVVQTRDGYLWVGSYNGLARFDGVRFKVFDDNNTPELRSSRITSLFEAPDGVLWIGTESGDVSQCQTGCFTSVPMRAAWGGGKIYAITADAAGDIWLLNDTGELARVRDGKVLLPPSGVVAKVVSLARSLDGTTWVEREGTLSALKDGGLSSMVDTNEYVQGICAAHDGGFWVASGSGVRRWKDGQWGERYDAPWGWSLLVSLIETSSGALAGGTSDAGLWLFYPGQTNVPSARFNRTSGLPSDWVISLCEDREKNLWCGTGAGLTVIRPNNIETVAPPDQWKGCPVLSVMPSLDGSLWVGTEGAGLYRCQNGNWQNYGFAQGISNAFIWSLAVDAGGKIWAGTWGGGLFAQRDGAFGYPPGLEDFRLPSPALLFLDGELWIGTTAGVLCYRDGKLERFKDIAGAPMGDVRSIVKDKSGAWWFGTAGTGLVRWLNGEFRRFKKPDGLSSDFIECLHLADDGALWIGTFGGGLNRFKDGKISAINQSQGLPNSVIGHIEEDGLGFLWMSSYGGILRASEQALNLCADGKIARVSFLACGISDGLPTLECSEGMQSAGAKTADGRLWFPTAKGLVAVDPAGVTTNALLPPVWIETMRVGDQVIDQGAAAGGRQVPPGRHRIEFEYTGLSFVAPEKVRFKCRLNGFESDWLDVGTKRVAIYNYVPPGRYTFQVVACNNDGLWNESGASLTFEVLPYFWQTTWFQLLGGMTTVAAASGMVWFDTRRRMRRRLEKLEREQAIERERARIAKDIHDDLGASLTRITMLSQSARSETQLPEPVSRNLDRIFATARELTRAMDEIVWAVNPRHDRLDSLANYLNRFAYDYLSAAEIRCRLDVPLELPALPVTAEVRHNLFLAFKESLHNVVKHAAATEVRVELHLLAGKLVLMVADNGRGFDSGSIADSGKPDRISRGNGLPNMQRRLAELGGVCEIQAGSAGGTVVRFIVPLAA